MSSGKTVLVCGGMSYAVQVFDSAQERMRVIRERAHLFRALDVINAEGQSEVWKKQAIGHGGIQRVIACGVDGASTCAGDWAIVNWSTWDPFVADYQRYGVRAIEERNRYVFEEVKPDLMLVFPGEGSEALIAYARKHQTRRQFELQPCCAGHPLPAQLSRVQPLQ